MICSPDATFFDLHFSYGMVAALEPIALRFGMGCSDVTCMALLGMHERMTAQRALAVGLVTEIVERSALLTRAQVWGRPDRRPAVKRRSRAPSRHCGTRWISPDLKSLASAFMDTRVGNPPGTAGVDRAAVKRADPTPR